MVSTNCRKSCVPIMRVLGKAEFSQKNASEIAQVFAQPLLNAGFSSN
jgi:hypothetical protein